MKGVIASFTRHTVFANIVLILIFVAGGMAVKNMVRETFPEFSLDVITVSVPWPGADPEEVEEGICRKIEEAIDGVEGIRRYSSTSAENVGTVVVEVREDYDVNEVKDRVRNKVDAISSFPLEAEKPITEEITLRQNVLVIALTGDNLTEKTLKEWAEQVKDEVRLLPSISQSQVLGGRDYEISIELSEERLREYGLTFAQVASVVRGSSLNLAGGTMRTEGEEIRLRTLGRKYTGKEFSEIVVLARPDGEIITLDRLATIRDAFTEDPIISRFNGHPSINVAVLKTPDEDTVAIDEAVHAYVARQSEILPPGMEMKIWGRSADILQQRIDLLLVNGFMGVVLVFLMLWLFLDIRLSFWAGMGIPTCIAGALAILWAVGATMNMISLFGLIMVVGIIVDDAIVVGEAIYVHRKSGQPPFRAAVEGIKEVGWPVVAAVTTTIVAFMPLFFVGGIMGKFISILPLVVIACLSISLVEALFLLPAHLSHLPDPNIKSTGGNWIQRTGRRIHGFTNDGLETFVGRFYEPVISFALRWRYVSLSLAIALFLCTMGLIESGIVKFSVFSRLDGDVMTARVEFPNGTPIEVTKEAVDQVEAAVRQLGESIKTTSGAPLITNLFSLTGSTISEDRPEYGNHLGSVRVEMLGTEFRGHHSEDLMVQWEKAVGAIPGLTSLTFAGMQAGPPGAPIEVWLQGNDMPTLMLAAADLKAKLATYDGVYQIQDDFRPGKNEIRLRLKPEARTMGLTTSDLARQIYAGYFGEEALRLQRGRDDIRVRVRYTADERERISDFENVRIRTPQGSEVPLLSVADLDFGPGYASIQRTDGMRRIAVTAEVDAARANANEVFDDLSTGFFKQLEFENPGVMVSLQGEKEKMRESLGSLTVTYPLALLGIYIIIATVFRSYIQPMIIMITIPFGLIGATFGHLIMGYELSMMSMFGMVALSGVVVNDAIVLIECVNDLVARGMPYMEALRRAGVRRFRAIFLTTVTTVGGLAPLMLEQDMQARFLIPMAISLSAGVGFATLLTLFLIPCLLAIVNDIRCLVAYLRTGSWPVREQVEPARFRNLDPDEIALHTIPAPARIQ